jgi:hypothetical protein
VKCETLCATCVCACWGALSPIRSFLQYTEPIRGTLKHSRTPVNLVLILTSMALKTMAFAALAMVMLVEGIPASPSPSRHPTHSVTRSHSHSQTKTGTSTATGTRTRSPSPTPATTIVIDMFPARLTLGSIKGHVEHLGNPTAYKVALYLQVS